MTKSGTMNSGTSTSGNCPTGAIEGAPASVIVRDMLAGKSTYGQFLESPEGIPTNILADRLRRLERFGIIKRSAYQERPVRHDYSLTPEGKRLGRVLRELADWGLENIAGTKKAIVPGSFVSKR